MKNFQLNNQKKKPVLIYWLLLIQLFVFSAYGQKSLPSRKLFELSLDSLMNIPVVSVGSNIMGLSEKQIPASIYSISHEEIKLTGARHLGELLQILVPAFMWVTDEDDFIFGFRGLVQDNNSTVVLLLNGQNVGFNYNQGMASHAGILDLNHIHHIEVITGPGSAELGAGPLTGVINIVTEDFLDCNGTAIEISENYGTGKFNDFNVLMNYRQDKIKFRISLAAFEQSDGYKPLTGNKQWVIPDGVIQDDKYFEHLPGKTIFLNGIYEDWNLSLFSTKTQWDPYVVDSQVVQVYETQGGKIERMINFNDRWKLNAMAHLNRVGLQERFHLKEPGQVAHTGETSYGSKVTCQFNTRRIKLSFGGDFQYYQYGENPFTRQNIYQTRGFPGLANQELSETIEPGNVPDYSQFHANVNALNSGFFGELYLHLNSVHGLLISSRYSNVDLYNESRFSPRFAFLGETDHWNWKIFYTRAFRTPIDANNNQIPAGGWFRHYNMPGLKTQSIDDFEVNCTFNYQYLHTEIRAFYAINKDIIQGGGIQLITPDNDVRRQYYWWTLINSGNIKSAGFEFFIKTYYKNFQMEFSHAFVQVLETALQFDTDLFVRTSNKKFLNYPDNVSRFHVTWRVRNNLRLRSDMLLDFGRYQGDPLFSAHSGHAEVTPYYQKTKKWLNINSGIIYQPFTHWELTVHFYNLLNQRPYWPVVFQNNLAVTATPRSFKTGIRFLF